MGLFSVLMQKIFHAGAVAEAPPDAVKPGQNPASRVEMRQTAGVAPAAPTAASPAPAKISEVDVEAVLNGLAAKHHEKLDWKHSIVDLMKLVGMDSSLSARKELAADLHHSGDTNDSAKMNIWLHKEVMKKLAENGGKVPQSLLEH
jgi:3-oxoacyl-ACP reductase-like protein